MPHATASAPGLTSACALCDADGFFAYIDLHMHTVRSHYALTRPEPPEEQADPDVEVYE